MTNQFEIMKRGETRRIETESPKAVSDYLKQLPDHYVITDIGDDYIVVQKTTGGTQAGRIKTICDDAAYFQMVSVDGVKEPYLRNVVSRYNKKQGGNIKVFRKNGLFIYKDISTDPIEYDKMCQGLRGILKDDDEILT